MRLNAPKKLVWYICVLLLIVGLVLVLLGQSTLVYGFVATAVGLVLLLLATLMKGL